MKCLQQRPHNSLLLHIAGLGYFGGSGSPNFQHWLYPCGFLGRECRRLCRLKAASSSPQIALFSSHMYVAPTQCCVGSFNTSASDASSLHQVEQRFLLAGGLELGCASLGSRHLPRRPRGRYHKKQQLLVLPPSSGFSFAKGCGRTSRKKLGQFVQLSPRLTERSWAQSPFTPQKLGLAVLVEGLSLRCWDNLRKGLSSRSLLCPLGCCRSSLCSCATGCSAEGFCTTGSFSECKP